MTNISMYITSSHFVLDARITSLVTECYSATTHCSLSPSPAHSITPSFQRLVHHRGCPKSIQCLLLGQVSVSLFWKCLPLCDSILSALLCPQNLFSRPRTASQAVTWHTGYVCSHPVVVFTTTGSQPLPWWVWDTVSLPGLPILVFQPL